MRRAGQRRLQDITFFESFNYTRLVVNFVLKKSRKGADINSTKKTWHLMKVGDFWENVKRIILTFNLEGIRYHARIRRSWKNAILQCIIDDT